MLNCYTKIYIQQIEIAGETDRHKVYEITNPIRYEVTNSCEQTIQTANVEFSRKIRSITQYDGSSNDNFIIDSQSKKEIDLNTQMLGFGSSTPLFRYGDMIQIWVGYITYDNNGNILNTLEEGNHRVVNGVDIYPNNNYSPSVNSYEYGIQKRSLLFTGYITGITSEMKVRLECQDYKLFFHQMIVKDQQFLSGDSTELSEIVPIINTNTKTYKAGTTQGMLSQMLYDPKKGLNINSQEFKTNSLSKYKLKPIYKDNNGNIKLYINDTTKDDRFGEITMEHSTVGDYINQIKDGGWGNPYFYPNSPVLNLSIFRFNNNPYDPITNLFGYQEFTFEFQKNIIHSNLDFKRNDSLIVGAIVKNTLNVSTLQLESNVTVNKKPLKPGQTSNIQVLVGQPGGKMYTFLYGRRDIFSDIKKLKQSDIDAIENDMRIWGTERLKTFSYNGYYGHFTTFGYPYVRHGDRVRIKDNLLPDRDGVYVVSKVVSYGGENEGLRQNVYLSHNISNSTKETLPKSVTQYTNFNI